MTQSMKAEGLGGSSLDDSLINLTGTILVFYYYFDFGRRGGGAGCIPHRPHAGVTLRALKMCAE